jgi:hypothetical protein
MEHEDSLQLSKEPATGPYPEPDEYSPYPPQEKAIVSQLVKKFPAFYGI